MEPMDVSPQKSPAKEQQSGSSNQCNNLEVDASVAHSSTGASSNMSGERSSTGQCTVLATNNRIPLVTTATAVPSMCSMNTPTATSVTSSPKVEQSAAKATTSPSVVTVQSTAAVAGETSNSPLAASSVVTEATVINAIDEIVREANKLDAAPKTAAVCSSPKIIRKKRRRSAIESVSPYKVRRLFLLK